MASIKKMSPGAVIPVSPHNLAIVRPQDLRTAPSVKVIVLPTFPPPSSAKGGLWMHSPGHQFFIDIVKPEAGMCDPGLEFSNPEPTSAVQKNHPSGE
jgi:hypothetical protein